MEARNLTRRSTRCRDFSDDSDPSHHSPIVSENRARSFAYAVAGCRYMLRWQRNIRIVAIATIVVASLAIWLRVSALELAVLALTIALVWLAEFINGAVEAVVNLVREDIQPMAKVAKDVCAGAVLLAAIASMVVGVLVLGPPILEWFGLASGGG